MQKLERIIFLLLGIFLVLGLTFFLIGYFKPKKAGILIETTPPASVFIDDTQVGRSPYEAIHEPGEIAIKLIPESPDRPLVPYESKVVLNSGIRTVIKREFGETEETSAGEVVSFEKVGVGETGLAIISVPDSAQVLVDGQVRGFTPLKVSPVSPGEHQLILTAAGYRQRVLTVRAIAGYKLTAMVQLAIESTISPSPLPQSQVKIMVEVLPTPGGFLRVREEPNITAKELTRVKPGEKFTLIEEDKTTGWFKIEFTEGQQGWISYEYAKKLD
jgi:hypothetical protein